MKLIREIFPKPDDIDIFLDEDFEELPSHAFSFIWYFVKKLKWALGCMTLLSIITFSLYPLDSWCVGSLIGILSSQENHREELNLVLLVVVIMQIFSRLLIQINHSIDTKIFPLMRMIIRQSLSNYLMRHSYRFFQADYAGRLAGKVIEMPDNVVSTISDILWYFFYSVITRLASCIVFILIDWQFSLLLIAYFIGIAVNYYCFAPKITKTAHDAADKTQTLRGQFLDGISHIFLTKVFGQQTYEIQRFKEIQKKVVQAEQDREHQNILLYRGQHILNALFQSGMFALSYWGFTQGSLSVSNIAIVLPLSLSLASSSWFIIENMAKFLERFATIDEALETIIQTHDIRDLPQAPALIVSEAPMVTFEKVHFSHSGQTVFQDFSLQIPAGQKVGLVGASGAGKSTLVQLLLRLFDVEYGAININGQNIAHVTQDSIRQHMTLIPQSHDLMHRSLFENITYGKPNATYDEVVAAAQKARIHNDIAMLQDEKGRRGYDVMVGERGVKLSGGQRQRVAIARAFLREAPILILDEATSALDSESERLIQQSLALLMVGKTTLIISHRLSTLSHLDRIIVLDRGCIVEEGTHVSLLAQPTSLYSRLWSIQSEGFLGFTPNPCHLLET